MPRPAKARMQFTPTGFSTPCSTFVRVISRPSAPRMISFAGALCTPRSPSLRAQMPARCAEGGIIMVVLVAPGVGSATWTHG